MVTAHDLHLLETLTECPEHLLQDMDKTAQDAQASLNSSFGSHCLPDLDAENQESLIQAAITD